MGGISFVEKKKEKIQDEVCFGVRFKKKTGTFRMYYGTSIIKRKKYKSLSLFMLRKK